MIAKPTLKSLRRSAANRTRLLYVSPERLGNERFLQLLERQSISLLAVDEAHCISEWGHNFRPDYLKIAALAKQLRSAACWPSRPRPHPRSPPTSRPPSISSPDDVVQTGFYRPNLELRVTPCTDAERAKLLATRLHSRPIGPTIVYVTLQRTAAEIAAYLTKCGFSARAYHAGMSAEDRNGSPRSVHGRRRHDCRRHDRLRHGHRQSQHPRRLSFQSAQEPGKLRPRNRPRGSRRQTSRLRVVGVCRRRHDARELSATATRPSQKPLPRLSTSCSISPSSST